MRDRRIVCFAAALLSAATLVQAQTLLPDAQAVEAGAAKTAAAPGPGRVERFLNTLERRAVLQNLVAPPDGFGIRVGGIDDGGGLALGPVWRTSSLAGGRVQAHASAALSLRLDREVETGVSVRHLAGDRMRVSFGAAATQLAQEHFYGLGSQSLLAGRTTFGLDRRSVNTTVAARPARWLELDGGVGMLRTTVRDVLAQDVFAPRMDYLHARLAATVDYRDQPGNPRTGGRYQVALQRYAGSHAARASFNRVDAELEQHLSAWKKQRMVTLRAIVSLSDADAGHDVPFYLQRTLGGSRFLRGFVHDRFRDRNLVVLQGEYGWDLMPFLGAVLFYEAGTVAPRARDLDFKSMRRDYGLGFRLGSARSVAVRTDVAFGSGEGTRFIMRFSHAF
jgi:hypothetical protein